MFSINYAINFYVTNPLFLWSISLNKFIKLKLLLFASFFLNFYNIYYLVAISSKIWTIKAPLIAFLSRAYLISLKCYSCGSILLLLLYDWKILLFFSLSYDSKFLTTFLELTCALCGLNFGLNLSGVYCY